MNKKTISHTLLLLANLIYALNYTLAKDVMTGGYIGSSGFILLRAMSGIFLFGTCYFLFIKERIMLKDLFSFAICGLFGIAINQLFFFKGLNLSTPINASIIMTSAPIIVILISLILSREKITLRKIIGVLLGCFGAVYLILNTGDISFKNDYMIGNILVLINATSYAIYLILVQPLIKKYNPITVMFFIFSFGILYIVPFGYQELIDVKWSLFSYKIIIEVIFVLVFTTFFAYLCNSIALKHLNATAVSVYIYLQPLLAALIAISLGSDQLDINKTLSCILIFTGVYIVSQKKSRLKQNLS